MASLYRKPVMITDPATGEKVKGKSAKWWGQFKDADGRLRRKPLAVDKTAAKAMLNEIIKRVEREKAGLVDPTEEQRTRPPSAHIKEFEIAVRTGERKPHLLTLYNSLPGSFTTSHPCFVPSHRPALFPADESS